MLLPLRAKSGIRACGVARKTRSDAVVGQSFIAAIASTNVVDGDR